MNGIGKRHCPSINQSIHLSVMSTTIVIEVKMRIYLVCFCIKTNHVV